VVRASCPQELYKLNAVHLSNLWVIHKLPTTSTTLIRFEDPIGKGTGNREQGTGKTELIPTESCMATPRKLSKIKYYSYSKN
jgi:hypothetical protein